MLITLITLVWKVVALEWVEIELYASSTLGSTGYVVGVSGWFHWCTPCMLPQSDHIGLYSAGISEFSPGHSHQQTPEHNGEYPHTIPGIMF